MLNSKLILIATSAASFELGSQVYFLISLISVLGLLIILSMIVFYRRRMKKLQYVHSDESTVVKKSILTDPFFDDPEMLKRTGKLQLILQLILRNDPGFLVKFNPFDPSFAEKILKRAPKLADAELEFCAMLRLNFGTKDIASCTGWSIQIIEQKKYRIRKKLGIPSSADLNSWMINV